MTTAIEQQIAALATRLRALEDREAIRAVIAAYGPAVDSGDSAGAANLWAADGQYDVGGMGVSKGHDAIRALFDGDIHQQLIAEGAAHVLSPVHIDLADDTATATGYSCVFRWDGQDFGVYRVAANRWELRREGDTWRVTRRVNRLLNGTAEARGLLAP
ncbi:nuclear transport factor 2 family protein [Sphingomonas sp. KC8]|uniref:nuclear transport factor 2 family protein n=1 Tax=Sphingomonas sp. KC8 TaxID=1030157 RepID=UPI000248B21F|nr:nuclear transport factor 2 family protein [Sphingomonas sp. KC8]ARS28403.1 hypothetical protein KC8_14060 [Sphingomonas sp. KC8]